MEALGQFFSILAEWKRASEAEARGIQSENWTIVSACQQKKEQLRKGLERFSSGEPWSMAPEKMAMMTAELMRLEQQNAGLLSDKMEQVRRALDELSAQRRALGQVQRAYAPARPGVWTAQT